MSDNGTNPETDPSVIDADDAGLLGELRLAVDTYDPVPPRLVETARAAFVWRTVDEELAHLRFDSLAGSEVLVRSDTPTGVHLSFATAAASIEVDVADDTILGQVVPAGASGVTLLLGSGRRVDTGCDELGQFSFPSRPSGPVRLVAHQANGDVVTEWFTV